MESFLTAVLEDPMIRSFDEQDNYLSASPYSLAPVKELELRTESNQLDGGRQEYALRVKPFNPWEVKRNNQYFQNYQELLNLDRQRELRDMLKIRYETIIEWVYLQEHRKLKEEDQKLSAYLITMLEAQQFSSFFDANEYAALKIEQIEKGVSLEDLHFEEDKLRNTIAKLYPYAQNQTISWSMDDLISVDKLQMITALGEINSGAGEIAYRERKISLTKSEMALEKTNIDMGFLQAKYEQYRIEQDRSPWSIGLGITIPIFNPNKNKITIRKLEMIEAEGELEEAIVQQQSGFNLASQKIKQFIVRYKKLEEQLLKMDVDALARSLQEMESSNPVVMIQLKRSIIKSKTVAARLKKEIYLAYIEYLAYAEMLQQAPFKNYLGQEMTW
jgi:hypothetical protein